MRAVKDHKGKYIALCVSSKWLAFCKPCVIEAKGEGECLMLCALSVGLLETTADTAAGNESCQRTGRVIAWLLCALFVGLLETTN